MRTKTLIAALLALGLLTACTQAAPESEAAVAEVVVSEPEAEAPEASFEEEEGEADLGQPWNEQGMYCCHYEVMTYPPPLGWNGETTTFEYGGRVGEWFTGAITFSLLPMPDGWDSPTHPIRMQGENGKSADLRIVPDGGVNAIGTIDWSHILGRPIGMAAYLAGATEDAGTLVFVFEVIEANMKLLEFNDDPACQTPRYVALTAQQMGPDKDYLTVALFRDGPWPPADSSSMCAIYHYDVGVISPRD
jgi:hypothetical protein